MADRLRYAFAITRGPNAGLGCGGWRIWTNNEDTYITATSVGGIWKASLHGDVSWRVAPTKENDESGEPILQDGHRNAPWEFKPTEFSGGERLAFVIAVSRNSLIRQAVDPSRETIIEVADRWDRLTALYVRMTEPAVALDPLYAVVGGPLPLINGRQVWVTTGEEVIDPYDPEPAPVSLMIQPVSPQNDGVSAPGFVVRGVNIG